MSALSLRWQLVRRLVALQSAMLTLLTLLVICTLWATGSLVTLEPEDNIIDAVQSAVTRDAADGLALRDTPALAKRRAEVPDLWFKVRDREGRSLTEGPVPREYAAIGAALDGIGQARLGWSLGDPPRPTARVKWVETSAGKVQIIAGPGGAVPLRRVALAASTLFMSVIFPVLALMAAATLIATPVVVRKTLAGLGKAATQAERINVDRRGTRLPVDDVPTEVMPLVTAVNNALGRIDDGYERHKRFLLDAAHELRTPIAILQTRLELLPPGPETTRLLEDVARLSILAEQLLDLQRLNHNTARFLPVDLVAVGRQVATDLAPLAIAAGYDVAFEPETEHVGIMGDHVSLERALTNLVQNAIQHGGRKGVIAIAVMRSGSLSVTDDGPGVPPEHRDRVFEPFHRLQARDRGVGLGLNLVQEIVRLHHGQITLSDGPTGSACFTMTFPPAEGSSENT